MDRHDQTITTTSGDPFTAKDHGALARLVYQRFGEDLASATVAWRRLLQNSATESDFAEILTWHEEPASKPPDTTLIVSLVAWRGLRQISLKVLHDHLWKMCPFGYIAEIYVTSFLGTVCHGEMLVKSLTEGDRTHKFTATLDGDYVTVKAFSKSRRFR